MTTLFPLVSCGGDEPEKEEQVQVLNFEVSLEQKEVIPTSILQLKLPPDARLYRRVAQVTFVGQRNEVEDVEARVIVPVEEDAQGDYVLNIDMQKGLFDTLKKQDAPEDATLFWGQIVVEFTDQSVVIARGEASYVEFELYGAYAPEVSKLDNPGTIYPGQSIIVEGERFLRPEEGQTWAVVERGWRMQQGQQLDLSAERVPVHWDGSRQRATLYASPLLVGIEEGELDVTLTFENVLRREVGRFHTTETHHLAGAVAESIITQMSPSSGSRGDIIKIRGRGFVPADDEGAYGMYLRFEGNFYPDADPSQVQSYYGPQAIGRIPLNVISEQEIEQDVWYDVNREEFVLEGLGAMPGRFEGRVTPVLVLGGQEEIGRGMVIDFTVKPTRQIVYVRFLPGFETGLERFGLRNTSPGIKRRILEVIRRDYQDFNVEVMEQPPEDSTRYMTLEIGGVDPTGMNLLGYDNSFNGVPKDTGNLFLEDYLGGYNLPGKDASFSPYGGVFVDSLVIFSPEISAPMGSVHPLFDEIMSPVMPELGGNRVMASEWPVTEGSSDRTRAIEGAIRLVGTIVGNTATHEIGHSLGLPYVEGEKADSIRYHNLGGDKEYIMDSGSDRPFEERAELEGRGPAKFSPENQAYLQRILPRQ